ncbi:MAG: hypothetical protein BAJATHORv1_140014 [Candidatus Thorarchaeota archaeon]|nr:MAG: hypothetical protein BAJATHORv1_140014 [Candidatus Thorarchaeota archaeon]
MPQAPVCYTPFMERRIPHASSLIESLVGLEADVRYRRLARGDEPEFLHVSGSVPVLVSAPHGATHMRDGEKKEEDEYTAGMAPLVAELAGAHAVVARRRSRTDPNADPRAPYRDLIRSVVEGYGIRFVLDLHGVRDEREFAIALGTMDGESCPGQEDLIIQTFEAYGFGREMGPADRLVVNDPRFTGGLSQDTITRFVSQDLGVPAAQVELHEACRIVKRFKDAHLTTPFHGDRERIERVIRALVTLVEVLA